MEWGVDCGGKRGGNHAGDVACGAETDREGCRTESSWGGAGVSFTVRGSASSSTGVGLAATYANNAADTAHSSTGRLLWRRERDIGTR